MPTRDPQRRLRLLVDSAIVSTFLLVVVGGVVRVSDAGLGCGPAGSGLRGWPLCNGSLVPASQIHTILEYSHRFLAALVTILLLAIALEALRTFRHRRALAAGALAAVLLVVAQGLLGAATVEYGLPTELVAAHLGLAMLLLGVLVGISLAVRRPAPADPGPRRLRAASLLAAAMLLGTIVTGGVIAGTEAHGTPGGDRRQGAHMACGDEFPLCNGSLLPFDAGEMVDVQLTHRLAMLLAVAALAGLALLLRRQRMDGLALAVATVLATQVWLGAMNVWVGKSPALVVAHLAVATLLWVLTAAAIFHSGARGGPARGG